MDLRALSWIEIRLLVKEIGSNILGSKIQKISVLREENYVEALIKLHKPNLLEKNLFFLVPYCFFLTSKTKVLPVMPHNFTMFLRNNLSGGVIESFEQVGSERIIRIKIRYHDEIKKLYFELFAPGNVVLCDENDMILGAYTKKDFKERSIKNKEQYVIPLDNDISNISFEDFLKFFEEELEIVKILAIKLRIGGQISEEILYRLNIDKNTLGKKVSMDNIKLIFKEFKKLFEEEEKAYFYKQQKLISPIKLFIYGEEYEILPSFNSELSNLLSVPKINKDYANQLKKINSVLEKQKVAVSEIEKGIDDNNNAGNAIYEKYSSIEKLVFEIKELLKKYSFLEVKEKIENSKFSEVIVFKNKNKIQINLDKL
ncbi:MAG TPA: NFACT family protein [Candidatus Woesearchaeota archaeon]|nr:NFACT family protein [Candidatus Woesearchaeota archaeon]